MGLVVFDEDLDHQLMPSIELNLLAIGTLGFKFWRLRYSVLGHRCGGFLFGLELAFKIDLFFRIFVESRGIVCFGNFIGN